MRTEKREEHKTYRSAKLLTIYQMQCGAQKAKSQQIHPIFPYFHEISNVSGHAGDNATAKKIREALSDSGPPFLKELRRYDHVPVG
jgi:hypothetical protein